MAQISQFKLAGLNLDCPDVQEEIQKDARRRLEVSASQALENLVQRYMDQHHVTYFVAKAIATKVVIEESKCPY